MSDANGLPYNDDILPPHPFVPSCGNPPSPVSSSASLGADTGEATSLRNARQLLDAKDAILEPGLWATMTEFVRQGGDSGEVPLLLARGLIGYPQIARLLSSWLGIAGVSQAEVEAIAWDAVKKEVRKRLDVRGLDDCTVRCRTSRPKFLDALLETRRGRRLVVDLYGFAARRSDYGRSDLLSHCLREIAASGYIAELLEAATLDLCEDWYLFEVALVDAIVRAARPNDHRASSVERLVLDVLRCCGSRLEAQCYANSVLETLDFAIGGKDNLLWRYVRQDKRLVTNPPLLRLMNIPRQIPLAQVLRDLVLSLARHPTVTTLNVVRAAYHATPYVAFLRVPKVAAALFQLAFDPVLAIPNSINGAADLIAAVATVPPKAGDNFGFTATDEDCISATYAATAACVSAAAHACLSEALSANGQQSTGELLLSATSGCAAARHGILVWIAKIVEDPTWMRTRPRSFASLTFGILRTAARSPRARRRIFNVYQRIVDAPSRMGVATHYHTGSQPSRLSEPYDSSDVSKAVVFGLVDLAADWSCAPDVLYFVQVSNSIDGALLQHFVLRLGKKVCPPYSTTFADAAANLLACPKARRVWRRIDKFAANDSETIRDFASLIASNLRDASSHCAYLTRLGTLGQITIALPKCAPTAHSTELSLIPSPHVATSPQSPLLEPAKPDSTRQRQTQGEKRHAADHPSSPQTKRPRTASSRYSSST